MSLPGQLSQSLQQSLCLNCGERRLITSGTGSVFLLCNRGVRQAGWPKYPPQPVFQCPHFRGNGEESGSGKSEFGGQATSAQQPEQ